MSSVMRPSRRRWCDFSSWAFIVAWNSISNRMPESFPPSISRCRRSPSMTVIDSGPTVVVNGSGRRRREAWKFHCLPGTATPEKASITLRFGW